MYRPKTAKSAKKRLPFEPTARYALVELGLFKASDDTIRLLSSPETLYHYKLAKASEKMTSAAAEAYNDSLWFALTKALSYEIQSRLNLLGIRKQCIPLDVCKDDPHNFVYVTEQYAERHSLVAVFPDGGELGVWTGRLISLQSIGHGSMEHFAQLFQRADRSLVIGNPTQIHWKQDLGEALTYHQFHCAGGRRIDQSTVIAGNQTSEAHIRYVLDHLILSSSNVQKITLIAVGMSAHTILSILDAGWRDLKARLCCIVSIAACFSDADITDEDFLDFLRGHCMNYCASDEPLGTPIMMDMPGLSVSGGHALPELLPATCLRHAQAFVEAQETS